MVLLDQKLLEEWVHRRHDETDDEYSGRTSYPPLHICNAQEHKDLQNNPTGTALSTAAAVPVGDTLGGRGGGGRGGGGRGGRRGGYGPFQTGHWWSTDGQGQSNDRLGGRSFGRGGGRGGRRGGRSGGGFDSKQYTLCPASGLSVSSLGAAISTGTAAATASAAATITGATITGVVAAVPTGAAAATTSAAAALAATAITGVVAAVSMVTVAPTISAATTISTDAPTASAAAKYDSLSHQAQMIVLMDRNALSGSNKSLTALYIKNIHDAVMRH
jgi:hypothetical protein